MSDSCKNNCSSCGKESCADRKAESFLVEPHSGSKIKKVIGVVSGKGGVGKSMVTSMLTVMTKRAGFSTAILDADITGPSIPRAFGVKEPATIGQNEIYPVSSKGGVPIMSLNLLTLNETDPVIWRGPVIGGTVKQFWTDVVWGDVDYMFIDMPPGTGDVPLTVFQSIPVDGIVIVTSPQELVGMIVEKAVNMAKLMNIPILALVENMSYFMCDKCGEKHYLFGKSHVEEIAERHGIKVTAKMPMNPKLAAMCDAGEIESFEGDWLKDVVDAVTA